MFSFEGFVRIDAICRGIFRVACLSVLWLATTLLGLVVLGFGPASYAMAKAMDRWLRHGETAPLARAFLADVRERTLEAMLAGWVVLGAGGVIVTNVFLAPTWILQAVNVLALVVLGVATAYVFPVMVATDIATTRRRFAAALLIGFGSLHWTIIGAAAVGVAWWLLWTYATPLLLLFGAGLPAFVVGLVTRVVFRPLEETPEVPAPAHRSLHHPMIAPATEQVS
ncbi:MULTISPECIES: YesL family protein [unclassified Isoptericola]|uniref:YesL family protein n=1 Tax=unclassified Isoptericola TaxID=2623355 RepID=UPI00364F3B31